MPMQVYVRSIQFQTSYGNIKGGDILNLDNIQKEMLQNQLSLGASIAIVRVAPAFRFGCTWGFVHDGDADYKEQLKALSQEPTVQGYRVENGFLIAVEGTYVAEIMNKLIPNAVDFNFLTRTNERRQHEMKRLTEYANILAVEYRGRQVTIPDSTTAFFTLAIYSTKISDVVTDKLQEYEGYKLSITETLIQIQKTFVEHSRTLFIELKDETTGKTQMFAFTNMLNKYGAALYVKILENCRISSGGSSLLINLAMR